MHIIAPNKPTQPQKITSETTITILTKNTLQQNLYHRGKKKEYAGIGPSETFKGPV
jgi:hypothetical protein